MCCSLDRGGRPGRTQGEDPGYHVSGGGLRHRSGRARRVFEVTGAGDTTAAIFVLGLAAVLSVETAARLGTAVVTPDELVGALVEAAQFTPAD
ncbi:PfkB family carbohydrate kinase [Gemmata massiliana]|uniref:PfkB family carbohydrate kinase n=1 Tax=Gemmata massiliana TaxID=1210884 RepID=UPI0013A6CA1D